MKKIFLLFTIGFAAITANAQKVKEADVPAAIKASFTRAHPTAKADKWEKEGNNYEVEFTENKIESSIEIGPNGQIYNTETEIAVSELPKGVTDYCSKNLPGKKIKEASKITDASGKISYEAEVEDADYIFDANGTFLEKKIEGNDKKEKDNK